MSSTVSSAAPTNSKSNRNPSPNPGPIAITMGDPAGVGPEILARTMLHSTSQTLASDFTRWILVGTRWALEKGAKTLGQGLPELNQIDVPDQALPGWNLLDLGLPEPHGFRFGQVQSSCGTSRGVGG